MNLLKEMELLQSKKPKENFVRIPSRRQRRSEYRKAAIKARNKVQA